jgi:hypothetical protein
MRRRGAFGLLVTASSSLLVACVLGQDLGSRGEGAEGASDPDASGGAPGEGDDGSEGERPPPDGGAPGDADAAGPTGPGPLGALPSGYCCTRDDECRFRKCVDTGAGNKMCLDACSASRPGICTRPGFAFTCEPLAEGGPYCQPPGASFACLDASTFERGTATTGTCCPETGDGTHGQHCEANLCLAIGSGPWFCSRRCDGPGDCPTDYRCAPVADRKQCVPNATPYTCNPT